MSSDLPLSGSLKRAKVRRSQSSILVESGLTDIPKHVPRRASRISGCMLRSSPFTFPLATSTIQQRELFVLGHTRTQVKPPLKPIASIQAYSRLRYSSTFVRDRCLNFGFP